MYTKLESRISDNQQGFRKGFGIRETLFGIQAFIERCIDINCDVYMCFVDFEVFDEVQHRKFINNLQNTEINDKDVRISANLY